MPDGYDPRYLAGVVLFQAEDYFEAHEVWEDLWAESHGVERKFYQGMIQAAVGLCHFGNGNLGGAAKLCRSSLDYLDGCGDAWLGVDLVEFRRQMLACFGPVLRPDPPRETRPDPAVLPRLTLDPEPESWPDPDEYLPADEHED